MAAIDLLLTGKLRWESQAGQVKIPYTGIPFILEGQRVLESGNRKQQKKSNHNEVSFKLNYIINGVARES